ncbi:TetR family transcriptional regulator [Corynebacterium sp.]|uniref:TetR family transcriptional regulator n=1 Tax=Corynebacterium sp. TaxID=1720 RepID=UPI0026E0860C|nr:TetR family transcriptional regulator [Corynebacterium sp.]MDO5511496.1 TetR family transcriptional regulator [Corynebacterium sp.]
MTPALTPEQLLLIADQFCATRRVQVRDFGALVAAAAVPGARISGIAVYPGPSAAGLALAEAVARLQPLTDANEEFGAVCREVYLRLPH